jgi:hypothetical protein
MFRLLSHNPYKLDWGNVTPDGYYKIQDEIMHVFNFDISSKDKIDRCIVFSVGKIIWSDMHVPQFTKQKIIYDLRGQPLVFLERAKKMTQDVSETVKKMNTSIYITIEILI